MTSDPFERKAFYWGPSFHDKAVVFSHSLIVGIHSQHATMSCCNFQISLNSSQLCPLPTLSSPVYHKSNSQASLPAVLPLTSHLATFSPFRSHPPESPGDLSKRDNHPVGSLPA